VTGALAIMPVGYFQVKLSLRPTAGGGAELLPPQAIQELPHHFVIVKEGGEEALIRVEASYEILKKLGQETAKGLEPSELEALRASYPKPKLKSRYRTRPYRAAARDGPLGVREFELDEAGNKIVDAVQTVRVGLHLIDVPLVAEALRKGS